MKRFKEGQKVICIGDKNNWIRSNEFTGFWKWRKPKKAIGPGKGEIVTVLGYHPSPRYSPNSIIIKEYVSHGPYVDSWFVPMQENVSVIELKNQEVCFN